VGVALRQTEHRDIGRSGLRGDDRFARCARLARPLWPTPDNPGVPARILKPIPTRHARLHPPRYRTIWLSAVMDTVAGRSPNRRRVTTAGGRTSIFIVSYKRGGRGGGWGPNPREGRCGRAWWMGNRGTA